MPRFASPESFEQFVLGAVVPAVEEAAAVGLKAAAELVRDEAKAAIGEYHGAQGAATGSITFAWARLAPATVEEKTRLGYAPPDHPLLRTGEMRSSIEASSEGLSAAVGSDSKVALYQEVGTKHVPPRPFLALAAHENVEKIGALVAEAVMKAIGGG